ncbi:MAG: hypothetical protein WCO35_00410 [Candidatus Nomurabacteria bacterium]
MKKNNLIVSVLSVVLVMFIIAFGIMSYKYFTSNKSSNLSEINQNTVNHNSSTTPLSQNDNFKSLIEKCVIESGVKICDLSHNVKNTNPDGTREISFEANKIDCVNVSTGKSKQIQGNDITLDKDNTYCVSDLGSVYIDPTVKVGKNFGEIGEAGTVTNGTYSSLLVPSIYKTCIWTFDMTANDHVINISNNIGAQNAMDYSNVRAFCKNGNNQVNIFTYNGPAQQKDVYKDSNYNFSIKLPNGVNQREDWGNPNGGSVLASFGWSNGDNVMITFSNLTCNNQWTSADASTVNINGINFLRSYGFGAGGGMESGSIDTTYCTRFNNISYSLNFIHSYPKYLDDTTGTPAPVPDVTITHQRFEQELKSLDFKFLK